ncbi:FtsX-like permease family protein [Nonomuraea jabiensis]|uniref:Putative ABC transport system permease protein n=1 Tax=Nonomuraea jabiensis TaxID=882448 RepID=A0A7W9FZD5_9ACTN|nr:FtsX-like permease family protein [Nonomuraea jabiensis]MBB5774279.1 putative ABC transport system permease protein [Nonomuraea jabiensis]
MSAFRAALRISRRDALRFKGRTALIMVMIGLPVLVITAVLTGAATTSITSRDKLDSRLGAADARIVTTPFRTAVEQRADGVITTMRQSQRAGRPWTPAEIGTLLQGRLLRYQASIVHARLADGYSRVDVFEADLRDPLTRGMRRLVEGRFAAAPGEVAVSPALIDSGVRIGDTIKTWRPDRSVRVVGVAEHPNRPGLREMLALPEGLLPHQNDGNDSGWLIDTAAPVQWPDVRRLNEVGLGVESRALIERSDTGDSGPRDLHGLVELGVAVVLIVTETVLLAGPAFAVGLRRRRRELAMIAAQGGSGRHLKTIVLADGLVLGGAAALLGAALGIGAGLAVEWFAARRLDWTHGPADVPWASVLGVAALGVVSALTAAIVPAIQASRQSPVHVLAGRAAVDTPGRAGRPVLGAVLVLLGVAALGFALHRGMLSVALASTLVVFGLVALMPWLVQATGRLAGRLPLPLRLSVRDASRHRVRTASATAAVMAATMGAVTLGIGLNSDYVDQEARRNSIVPADTLMVRAWKTDDQGWARVRALVQQKLPGVSLVNGLAVTDAQGEPVYLNLALPGGCTSPCDLRDFPGAVEVADEEVLAFLQKRRDPQAAAALAAGKAVAFSPGAVRDAMLTIQVENGDDKPVTTLRVPAVAAAPAEAGQTGALIPPSVLTQAGLKVQQRTFYAAYTDIDDQRLSTEIRVLIGDQAYALVERGTAESRFVTLLILLGAALVLVLGGTFAATGLAAADMRPDLDTLSAVGGAARVRRLVVAAQAAYISGLGALVGLAAGLVSGIALTWPLTRTVYGRMELFNPGATTIAVPWLFLAGVVVGLPLLAALVAGLFTRTRLVLARRVA